jgi:LysR family glycine cleavage system transcriptional activator
MRERLGGLRRPEDLLNAPLIGVRDEWDAWFQAAGVIAPHPGDAPLRLAADTQVLEIASALGGHGLVLASPIFFAAEIASGRLVRPFETTVRFGDGFWLAYPSERRRAPKIVAFRDWVLTCVAEDPALAPYRPKD